MHIESLDDLFLHFSQRDPALARFRKIYDLQRQHAVRMKMSPQGWNVAKHRMQTENREELESQTLIIVRDRLSGHEVSFNHLRMKRVGQPAGEDPATLIDLERAENPCPWCDPKGYWQPELWADEFGQVWEKTYRRFVAQSNWARLAPISGIALGNHEAHNLLRLSLDQFMGMFDVAERYIKQARKKRPAAKSFIIFLNGGPKAAASVAHAHIQIVGKEGDQHFGYAETLLTRCGPDYWERVREVHEDLELIVTRGRAVAWVNVAPVRDRDITIASATIREGAQLVYDLLQVLIERGTNNFTLAAILSPEYVTNEISRHGWKWPLVLWRLIDRGDMRVKHSDVGAMEFFGSCVVASDPFKIAQWVKGGIRS
jgi:diadenosine tetraphosphate (Ap4A) HIT family hydrolase